MIVLAVIFPKADFADFVTSTPMQGSATAAWTTVCPLSLFWFRDVFKHVKSLH
jgi:hypothetical protein